MDKQDQAAPLVSVTFIGSASPYHEGDLAGFRADEAKAYVDNGKAVYTQPGVAAQPDTAAEAVEQPQAPAEAEAEAEAKPARKK